MSFKTLFLDLDDTVYPATSEVWKQIAMRINRYMIERVHISPQGIVELRERLFHTYGTTMRGLISEYGIDAADYLAFVHDIPLKQYIGPDLLLREALERLPQRKVIFTNADTQHARRVLQVIGIDDQIDQIIDVVAIDPYCKPHPGAFETALALAGETDPTRIAFFDDNVNNLKAARDLGFFTVRVGNNEDQPDYHASILRLSELEQALKPSGAGLE